MFWFLTTLTHDPEVTEMLSLSSPKRFQAWSVLADWRSKPEPTVMKLQVFRINQTVVSKTYSVPAYSVKVQMFFFSKDILVQVRFQKMEQV